MKKWFLMFTMCWVALSVPVYASDSQMKTNLVKIVNQLEAIKPLINQAKQEQSANPRTKVHFDSWVDSSGQVHSGLRQDIEDIQQALINVINQKNVGPRIYKPIRNDFLGKDHV